LPPPRDEDEIRGGGRLIHEARAVVVDQQPAIDALADLDAAAGVGARVRAARDHQQQLPGGLIDGRPGISLFSARRLPSCRQIVGDESAVPGSRGTR
jgi:hypothetical protein